MRYDQIIGIWLEYIGLLPPGMEGVFGGFVRKFAMAVLNNSLTGVPPIVLSPTVAFPVAGAGWTGDPGDAGTGWLPGKFFQAESDGTVDPVPDDA